MVDTIYLFIVTEILRMPMNNAWHRHCKTIQGTGSEEGGIAEGNSGMDWSIKKGSQLGLMEGAANEADLQTPPLVI